MESRRDLLKTASVGGFGLATLKSATASAIGDPTASPSTAAGTRHVGSEPMVSWGRGIEGQRMADLGNGNCLNPIMAGDHPDPTILKDGENYYMAFSSFAAYPALVIWHSQNLVSWTPVATALEKPSRYPAL
jgi:xylan 1,4-beta-xylosidase